MRGNLVTSGLALLLVSVTPSWVYAAQEVAGKHVRVGAVYPESPSTTTPGVPAFWRRLSELGWVEGRNLTVETRWAHGEVQSLPALMTEVVGRNVDVLVTWTTPAVLAAKSATASTGTPVVAAAMADPISTGIVSNLARPGGNITGLSLGQDQAFAEKWLQLLHDTVPHLSQVAVLFNPDNPAVKRQAAAIGTASSKLQMHIHSLAVRRSGELSQAFAMAKQGDQAVVVLADALTMQFRQQIAEFAAKARMPSIFPLREFVDAGGLIAYGANNTALSRRAAEYVDQILRGAQPGDLPIEQPTEFDLVVNLKTAKHLRLIVPQSILFAATDIISK